MHNASLPVAARVYDDVAPAPAPLPDALGARSRRSLFDHQCNTGRRRSLFQ